MAERLGCEREDVEAVLGALQQMDPPGVFARSLSECLALQLRRKDRLDPAMAALVDNLPCSPSATSRRFRASAASANPT
jgi:RNA polymerase sigma-54 factor